LRRSPRDQPKSPSPDTGLALLIGVLIALCPGPHRGEAWRRLGDRVEARESEPPHADPEASVRVPQHGGMSLHADVSVPARDRRRLERLCRYVARPPLASERLEQRSDGTLALRLKSRWRDGTTHIVMERRELIERLVPLIPPPRAHQVRYHGILAPGASQRGWIVPGAAVDGSAEGTSQRGGHCGAPTAAGAPSGPSTAADPLKGPSDGEGAVISSNREKLEPCNEEPPSRPDPANHARRIPWAALLQRVFEIDALRCPHCGSAMRLIAAIEDPAVAHKILECLKLPARSPPLTPAEPNVLDLGPDDNRWFSDESPAHDVPEVLVSDS
jgi:hypothetical protein